MKSNFLLVILVFSDWLSAFFTWFFFYYFRKTSIENVDFSVNNSFYIGITFLPVAWLILYALQGIYKDVKRLYRLRILISTFSSTLIGSIGIFFIFLLDDKINSYSQYYYSVLFLFFFHFIFTFFPRIILVSYIVKKIHNRKDGFKTLIIGGSDKAINIYKEINDLPKGIGCKFVGFLNINGVDKLLEQYLPYLGHIDNVETVLCNYNIEEVIIAIESSEHDKLKKIISRLEFADVNIKVLPDMYDILSGTVKMNNIFGALLINIKSEVMPISQRVFKRILDIVISLISLVLLTPVYIILAILVKLTSPGPIIFRQDRIGKNGKLFRIVKFRTMFVNSEVNGPQLSSSNDARITNVGRFMRRSRLDEFLQFYNVLIGEMSLVGPRPERQFFIDKIVEREPQFLKLTKVRPGITSWGQVKYGYAENVDQMIDRMKYDLLYLKNRSLSLDFKIMFYTILIIFKGTGK